MAHLLRSVPRKLNATFGITSQQYICRTCQHQIAATQSRRLHLSQVRRATTETTESKPQVPATQETPSNVAAQPKEEDLPVITASDAQSTQLEAQQAETDVREELSRDEEEGAFDPRDLDPNYTPAETWHNLERVGSEAWQAKQRDPGDKYRGWAVKRRPTITPQNVDAYVDRVARSVFGKDAKFVTGKPLTAVEDRVKMVQSMAETLGMRPSDAWLKKAGSFRGLRSALLDTAKPTKFSEALETSHLKQLPNVSVKSKRVIARDQDEARGRWKLIVQALSERGLPVTPSRATRKKRLL